MLGEIVPPAPLRQILSALGYRIIDRSDIWAECFVANDDEGWRGKGRTADEALEDAVAQMLPSSLGRTLLARYEPSLADGAKSQAVAPAAPASSASSASSVSLLQVRAAAASASGGAPAPQQIALALSSRGLAAVVDGGKATAPAAAAARLVAQALQLAFESTASVAPLRMRGLPALLGAVQRANREILDVVKRDPKQRSMQASFAAVLSAGGQVAIAHIGTASVYRLRGAQLDVLTVPGSGKAAERIGVDPKLDVETTLVPGEAGTVYLACTTGPAPTVAELAGFDGDLDDALAAFASKRPAPWAGAAIAISASSTC